MTNESERIQQGLEQSARIQAALARSAAIQAEQRPAAPVVTLKTVTAKSAAA